MDNSTALGHFTKSRVGLQPTKYPPQQSDPSRGAGSDGAAGALSPLPGAARVGKGSTERENSLWWLLPASEHPELDGSYSWEYHISRVTKDLEIPLHVKSEFNKK